MANTMLPSAVLALDLGYQQLKSDEIRVIDVEAGGTGHSTKYHLRCTLRTINLSTATAEGYLAVSYTWQDADGWTYTRDDMPSDSISICGQSLPDEKLRFLVRAAYESANGVDSTNSVEAAYSDSVSSRSMSLWLDALSINQVDVREKSQQVSQMRDIFLQAQDVVVVLGNPPLKNGTGQADSENDGLGPTARPGVDWQMLTLNGTDVKAKANLKTPSWLVWFQSSRDALVRHPFWRRSWIIQEVVNASSVAFLVGQLSLELESFVHTLEILHDSPSDSRDTVFDQRYITILQRFRGEDRPSTLEKVLEATRYSNSSDPVDQVYAKFGLAQDSEIVFGPPDYRLSVEDVLLKLCVRMMTHYRSLRLLCFVESARPGLPSWVPDWTRWQQTVSLAGSWYAFERENELKHVPLRYRFSDDSLVLHVVGLHTGDIGHEQWQKSDHPAKHSTLTPSPCDPTHIFQTLVSIFQNLVVPDLSSGHSYDYLTLMLATRAAFLDNHPRFASTNIRFQPSGWQLYDDWYTSYRSYIVNGKTLQHWVSDLFNCGAPDFNPDLGVAWPPLQANSGSDYSGKLDDAEIWVLKRFSQFLPGRRLTCLVDGSSILAPQDTQTGDMLCILFNCPHPVVLRPVGLHFLFVGECYIDRYRHVRSWDELCHQDGTLREMKFEIH